MLPFDRHFVIFILLHILPQVGYQASYNIYNFDQEDPASNMFDVTSCYDDFSQQPFIVEFAGKIITYAHRTCSLKSINGVST